MINSLKTYEHKSEQRVLWNLEATFEELLEDPFKSDYKKIINDARNTIISNIDVDE